MLYWWKDSLLVAVITCESKAKTKDRAQKSSLGKGVRMGVGWLTDAVLTCSLLQSTLRGRSGRSWYTLGCVDPVNTGLSGARTRVLCEAC